MANRIVLNETSYFGPGSIQVIPGEVGRRGFKKALVVTDKDLVKFGVVKKVTDVLESAGIPCQVYDNVKQNPTIENVQTGVEAFKQSQADFIITIGGGSSIDTAKVAAVLATNNKDVREILGIDKIEKPGLRTIFIPTTAGSGSEVTNVAILSDTVAKLKVGVVSPYLIAHTVLLDAELTVGLPPAGTAASGIDALIHAVEAYTSFVATPASDM